MKWPFSRFFYEIVISSLFDLIIVSRKGLIVDLLAILCSQSEVFTYGPVAPGRGKPSIFVYLFFEMQSWCGLGNVDIKVWSSVTLMDF